MTTQPAHTSPKASSTPAKIDPFPVNKSIFIGTGLRDPENVFRQLESECLYLGDWARILIVRPTFMVCLNRQMVDLVFVGYTDLGLFDGVTRKNVFERARRRGLKRCSEEVAIQLRLQYPEQPLGEKLIIAMDPALGGDGTECTFIVEHCRDKRIGRWINAEDGDLETPCHEEDIFVFVKPRVPPSSSK